MSWLHVPLGTPFLTGQPLLPQLFYKCQFIDVGRSRKSRFALLVEVRGAKVVVLSRRAGDKDMLCID